MKKPYPKNRKSSTRAGTNIKHGGVIGGKPTPEYNSWSCMKQRCCNPRHKRYAKWGGRGITICDRWLDSFANFLADMGPKPSDKHTIDRIDNDGGYSPENCRWALPVEQSSNMRTNVRYTFKGETLTMSQWIKKLGFRRGTLERRLSFGWSVDKAFSTPPQQEWNWNKNAVRT